MRLVAFLEDEFQIEIEAYETGMEVISAPAAGPVSYRVSAAAAKTLRAKRLDTVVVAGEGNRRAELLALLAGPARRVEVRGDGAAHVFWLAPYKPVVLAAVFAAGLLEKLALRSSSAALSRAASHGMVHSTLTPASLDNRSTANVTATSTTVRSSSRVCCSDTERVSSRGAVPNTSAVIVSSPSGSAYQAMNAAIPACATNPTHERSPGSRARYQGNRSSIRCRATVARAPVLRRSRCTVASAGRAVTAAA